MIASLWGSFNSPKAGALCRFTDAVSRFGLRFEHRFEHRFRNKKTFICT